MTWPQPHVEQVPAHTITIQHEVVDGEVLIEYDLEHPDSCKQVVDHNADGEDIIEYACGFTYLVEMDDLRDWAAKQPEGVHVITAALETIEHYSHYYGASEYDVTWDITILNTKPLPREGGAAMGPEDGEDVEVMEITGDTDDGSLTIDGGR